LGVAEIAAVIGRLSTAALELRHLHLATRVLEKLDGRESYIGAHQVHQAGDEQTDTNGRAVVAGR
jgi:hypothetical protein